MLTFAQSVPTLTFRIRIGLISGNQEAWIGLKLHEAGGYNHWYWHFEKEYLGQEDEYAATPFSYQNWDQGQPETNANETVGGGNSCVAFTGASKWATQKCTTYKAGVVCQIDKGN